MTRNLQLFLTLNAPKRILVLVVLVSFLTAQFVASWHSAQHAVHANNHCNICASISQLDHAVPVVAVKVQLASHVAIVVYKVTAQANAPVAIALAYDAQGPPSA